MYLSRLRLVHSVTCAVFAMVLIAADHANASPPGPAPAPVAQAPGGYVPAAGAQAPVAAGDGAQSQVVHVPAASVTAGDVRLLRVAIRLAAEQPLRIIAFG